MLTIQDLSCQVGGASIFSGINISIYAGSLVLIKGKNGSGKTSFLELISGLKKPEKGEIFWCKENIKFRLNDIFNINYVSHKNSLKLQDTVFSNLEFWAKLAGTAEMLSAAIYYFGLQDLLDMKCADLSAGWQRRVALARLMCSNSHIWLLDEPDSNLDIQAVELVSNCIKIAVQRGMIVFVASHHFEKLEPNIIIDIEEYKTCEDFA
jgi:heme exporter protein A